MLRTNLIILFCCFFSLFQSYAQSDSGVQQLKKVPDQLLSKITSADSLVNNLTGTPEKNLKNIDTKIDEYGYRVISKLAPADSVIQKIKNTPNKLIKKVDSKVDQV